MPGQGAAALDALPDEVEWELLVATPHGPWRPWGTVRTTGELPAPLGRQTRFNPWTTGGGIRPAGPWQTWRREVVRRLARRAGRAASYEQDPEQQEAR